MTKTFRDKFCEALILLGETQVQSRSSRYIVFTRQAGGYYYLGKSGSIRYGINKRTSIPVSEKFKQQLLNNIVN